MERSQDNTPFFIVGAPRSGTTLLVQLLNRHPKIFVPPETEFFLMLDRYQYGHSRVGISEIPAFTRWYLKTPSAVYLELDGRATEPLMVEAIEPVDVFANLMQLLLERSGKECWGEKTPEHLHHVDVLCHRFPESRFIIVIRDGRAVVRSRLKHPEWRDNLFSAARKWQRDIRSGLDMKKYLGNRCLEVQYETLVKEPQATLRQVLDFLGEDRFFQSTDNIGQSFENYYSQPWMRKSTDAPDQSRIDAWLNQYTPIQLRALEFFIGEQLQEVGYPLVRPSTHMGWMALAAKVILQDFMRRICLLIGRQVTVLRGQRI